MVRKTTRITPAGKACVACVLMGLVYGMYRVSQSKIARGLFYFMETADSFSAYHHREHQLEQEPEQDMTESTRLKRKNEILVTQAAALKQAHMIMAAHKGIEINGHPFRMFNGVYGFYGEMLDGFPVYNNSHRKYLYHVLPEGWEILKPEDKPSEGWDKEMKCPRNSRGDGGACICWRGYHGDLTYDADADRWDGDCQRTPMDEWFLHSNIQNYKRIGNLIQSGAFVSVTGEVPVYASTWRFDGREDRNILLDIRYADRPKT